MPPAPELQTAHLLLRHWVEDDRAPFAAMNRDPVVMEHLPAPLTPAESDALVERAEHGLRNQSFGLWALEAVGTGQFLGFTGLAVPSFEAHFTPAVEMGWRLRREAWGRGFAQEAARRVRDYAFGEVGLEAIVSFTARTNLRSQRVMQRIGMTHDEVDDFEHPRLPAGHALRDHVLYRLSRERWASLRAPR